MKNLLVAILTLAVLIALPADAARSKKVKGAGDSGDDAVPTLLPCQPNEIEAYNRGVDALDKKDYATARKYFQAAIQLNDRFPEAHNNLAFTLRMISLDNAEASLNHYARALKLAPGFPQALYYRGVLYVQLGRTTDAEKARDALASQDNKDAKEYADQLTKVIKRGKSRSKQDALSIYGLVAP
jgi:tetratricopeptide (TPR) repeat protein